MEQQSSPEILESLSTSVSTKSNLPLIIGGIVLLILISIGSYIFGSKSQKSDKVIYLPTAMPTEKSTNIAGWKVYMSKNNEFSFEYPQKWIVHQSDIESTMWEESGQIVSDSSEASLPAAMIDITVYKPIIASGQVSRKFSLDDFKKDTFNDKIPDDTATIGSTTVYKYLEDQNESLVISLVFEKSQRVHHLNFLINKQVNFNSNKNIVDHIITSLKISP